MTLEFPVIKLLDYEAEWDVLEASINPFAVVVMAHLRTLATTQDPSGRLRSKLKLIRDLYDRGYSQQDILELFRLLDWMMGLPEELEIQFRDEVRQLEEEKNMPYVTSIERIGKEEGRNEGRSEEREAIIIILLKTRFGEVDEE